ncbi:MAG: M67 family metallopeptidase [Geobacteraceae bacterium]
MLKIPQHIHDDIIAHAREGLPLEVCGILGGSGDTVKAIYRVTNSDASNEHFSMEPKEQFAVVKDMRIKGVKMLAIYHSHPETPARPSEEDIRMALTPGISYVIVSMMAPDAPTLRSFKISDGQVQNEEVQVV